VGVEPTLPCGKHDFQSCAFGHSAISPVIGLRREWESNPRYLAVNLISNQAPSATRPSLRWKAKRMPRTRQNVKPQVALPTLHIEIGLTGPKLCR
jgi:hypothetical protein